jgi:hypothetical protein
MTGTIIAVHTYLVKSAAAFIIATAFLILEKKQINRSKEIPAKPKNKNPKILIASLFYNFYGIPSILLSLLYLYKNLKSFFIFTLLS